MSELETFRDHCRAMANWQPPELKMRTKLGSWCVDLGLLYPNHPDACDVGPMHDRCTYDACACECHPQPEPPTGPSEAERALFTHLADEVDAYLTADDAPLWEDA